ncbi:sensor histidine kinase [Nocardioides sp. P5_E3]
MRTVRSAAWLPRGGGRRLVVLLGLTGFVVGVYVLVVRGGGTLIGHTDSPSLALSVAATVVVALSLAPVQAALDRWVRGPGDGAPAAYDILTRFSDGASDGALDGDSSEEPPVRMARLLAEGTGALWAQVWLVVSGRPTLAASWPSDADEATTVPEPRPGARDATGSDRRALAVAHDGELLGVLRLQERPGLPLSSVEERLFGALASRAGLMLRLAGVRAELERQHRDLEKREDDLTASRERLIGAQDAERRRLERDLHDGAQQHLVALAVNLRLVQTLTQHAPERATDLLARQGDAATVAIETLSSLSRGIYPRLLSDKGLVPALLSGVTASAIPVTVTADGTRRLPAAVEAALYFCCMEAVQNAAKHSGAAAVAVRLSDDRDTIHLAVTDDGTGFDPDSVHNAGAGLSNMRDRLDAVGGTVTVASLAGTGTTVTALVSPEAV